jgi:hypothetical protein
MARTVRRKDFTGYSGKDSKADRKAQGRGLRADTERALRLMARDLGLVDDMTLPIRKGTQGRLTH